jgi:hypothetical protein
MQEKQQARRLPQGDHRQGDLPDEHRSAQTKAKVERRSQGHSTGYFEINETQNCSICLKFLPYIFNCSASVLIERIVSLRE